MTTDVVEILLVEDNPADVRLAEEALCEGVRPHHLSVPPDGVEALAFLRREGRYAAAPRPDLILLDLNLPRKGGREVLAEVKEDPDLRAIPVIVLTTSRAEGDIAAAYDLHANCYMVKGEDLDLFFDAIARLDHFWFDVARLPARPAVPTPSIPAPAAPTPSIPAPAVPATVLIVDDDAGIVDFLTTALEDHEYRVFAALDAEALRVARERRPDVILAACAPRRRCCPSPTGCPSLSRWTSCIA